MKHLRGDRKMKKMSNRLTRRQGRAMLQKECVERQPVRRPAEYAVVNPAMSEIIMDDQGMQRRMPL